MKKRMMALAFVVAFVVISVADDGPKVNLSFNRYYDTEELYDALKRLNEAFPKLTELESAAKSYQGRDIWLMTVNNPDTGQEMRKPAFFIEGNIHGNEIQGSEVCLYTLWFLLENYGKNERITKLVDRAVFYVAPTVNPDGRAFFFNEPNNPSSSRSSQKPRDDDHDGLIDEDGYDDLDGDGNITSMRKKDPAGRWKADPADPRVMVRAEADETGGYIMLGMEGIDNDNDGVINEDQPGYYDMNRNYGFNWQPEYVQSGAGEYPFSHLETNGMKEFLVAHPNIIAAQSYHNFGGMILVGPGSKDKGAYPFGDIQVYDYLGKRGEKILPGYRYIVIWKDLYTVYGGSIDYFYRLLGIYSFTNELNLSAESGRSWSEEEDAKENLKFDDHLRMGDGFNEWTTVNHPTYGEIEVGGWTKFTQRIPPPWKLEETCHRNAAFTIFHAENMPLLRFRAVKVEKLEGDLFKVSATVVNEKPIPTRSAQAVQNKLGLPDFARLKGEDVEIVAAGIVRDKYRDLVDHQKNDISDLRVQSLRGMGEVILQWIVRGNGKAKIIYDSQKGGFIEKEIELR